jgi:DNA primase
MDVLALRLWGVPGLGLLGTGAGARLALLDRFERVYLALDQDGAGKDAARRILREYAERAFPMQFPGKDPADLALRPDGERLFRAAMLEAETRARAVKPTSLVGGRRVTARAT